MSERIPLAIVGCGGMGNRHLSGFHELTRAGLCPFELVAACDPVTANAEALADEAEKRLGSRPAVVPSVAELRGVAAVDVCTSPPYHHVVAEEALALGLHMMTEKPMGLTVRACQRMRDARAANPGMVLSVAENFRRDPMYRLAKALVQSGALGDPRLYLEIHVGGSDRIVVTPWRHDKFASGLLLDVGVHFTDMTEYLIGEVVTVYAQTRLHEPVRRKTPGQNETGPYAHWPLPDAIDCTAEDAAYATFTFANGAVGQYTEDHAAHGRGFTKRALYGSEGSADFPGDRSGRPLTVSLRDGTTYEGDEVLDLVSDFHLDEVTAALYGGDRLGSYEMSFSDTDAKLLAIEYADFGRAIQTGEPPEVDGLAGMRAVALAYATLESQATGRVVTMQEVMRGDVREYQAEIDDHLGI